jgi:hypothetical protein
MPSKMKIGAYDWGIVVEDGDAPDMGEANFEHNQIRIWRANVKNAGQLVGIIIHECFHILYEQNTLAKVKRDREEKVVTAFEVGTVSLLRDNPKFVTWMKR